MRKPFRLLVLVAALFALLLSGGVVAAQPRHHRHSRHCHQRCEDAYRCHEQCQGRHHGRGHHHCMERCRRDRDNCKANCR